MSSDDWLAKVRNKPGIQDGGSERAQEDSWRKASRSVLGYKYKSCHVKGTWKHPYNMAKGSIRSKGKKSHLGGYQRANVEEVLLINRARLSHYKGSAPQIKSPTFYFTLLYLYLYLSFLSFSCTLFLAFC